MKNQRGMSLIELVMFIIVLGIFVTGSLLALNTMLLNSYKTRNLSTAGQLAEARMNLIKHQRLLNGVTGLSDPCAGGSPPTACTALATFATAQGYTVSSSFVTSATDAVVTVTVGGTSAETIVERFIK